MSVKAWLDGLVEAVIMDRRQLELFESVVDKSDREATARAIGGNASSLLCWTRMQTEAGEGLARILERKETERRAGNGIFFWGIGNSISVPEFWPTAKTIPVVFSRMLSRPKSADVTPDCVVVWRKYIDIDGRTMDLPPQALVTSRGRTLKGPKTRHLALVCRSNRALKLGARRTFDPTAYLNVGGLGRPVGFSQVTALVQKVRAEAHDTRYHVDMEAVLVSPFVVRLADPGILTEELEALVRTTATSSDDWLSVVSLVRAQAVPCERPPFLPIKGRQGLSLSRGRDRAA